LNRPSAHDCVGSSVTISDHFAFGHVWPIRRRKRFARDVRAVGDERLSIASRRRCD
jgi:hypothetical protein